MNNYENRKNIPEQLRDALATIETMKAEAVTLKSRIETVRDQLAAANTNLEAARASVTTLTAEKATLTTQLAEAKGKVTARDAEITTRTISTETHVGLDPEHSAAEHSSALQQSAAIEAFVKKQKEQAKHFEQAVEYTRQRLRH